MLTLLNTRPAHQAEKLNKLLAAAQVGGCSLPALQIVTTQQDLTQLDEQVWVFVSKNAVEHFAKQLTPEQKDWWKDKDLVTVGPATDKACAEQGWGNRQEVPVTYDSEGMIQLEIFDNPQELTVGIIRGNGGRPWLAEQLTQAGAQVNFYEVYAREAVPLNQEVWQEFKSSSNQVVLFTSVSSMEATLDQLDEVDQQWIKEQKLIVYSSRIAEEATKINWQGKIYITENSSDEATLKVLEEIKVEHMSNSQTDIVEAEVLEQESINEVPETSKSPKKKSFNFTLLIIILVSALALGVSAAAWYQLQKLTQVWSDNLNYSKSAITELQSSLTKLESESKKPQPSTKSDTEINHTLDEMQLMLKDLMQKEQNLKQPQSDLSEEKQQQLEELNEQVEDAITTLNKQLEVFQQATQDKAQEITDYLSSEDWEQDKQALQETIEMLGEQVTSLSAKAMKHAEMLEKLAPQLEQKFEEIQPRLQGLSERLLQLFTIRKYEEEEN